ncbi:GmrSD restriction endonuclease domain-containing protein [Agrobacterium cavarae]|uniref:GmrSD restriction endonuclease domain-containing protein n=1 Tax=Agrobacterium cavarae TaxID=2528239 RepID=UPI003FCF6059
MNNHNSNQNFPDAALSTRMVGNITGHFRIFSYQRGYRWGQNEVRQLLDDIWESNGALYRLQPLVVRAISDGAWELIDGQQRLTTLYLIYQYMQRSGLTKPGPSYSIDYETRPGSAAFLRNPDVEDASKNIDFHFLHQAYLTISDWFGTDARQQQGKAIKLFTWLDEAVEVIWYEASQDENAIAIFSRLNIGRIPLTAAELIKAHLLTQLQASQPDRVHSVAAQWDSIERDLRHPELWAFVSREDADAYPTRITLLLDTVALRYPAEDNRDFGGHQSFESLRKHITSDPVRIWNEVVELHARVLGWFEDHDFYHRIGFLIAVKDRFAEIVALARNKLADEFSDALVDRIRSKLNLDCTALGEIGYETAVSRDKSQRALLLMNVETVRHRSKSGERFPFAAHHAGEWSLEHIHAQNAEALTTENEWSEWLDQHLKVLISLPVSGELDAKRNELIATLEAVTKPVKRPVFETIAPVVFDFLSSGGANAGASSAGDVHDITNLALLQRGANSALSNSVFEVKRQMVLSKDKSGEYIPVCTRQVFLKYFGDEGARSAYFWGPSDRKAYFNAIEMMLRPYLKETD